MPQQPATAERLGEAIDTLRKISASLDSIIAAVGTDPSSKNLRALIAVAALCSQLSEQTVERLTGEPADSDAAVTAALDAAAGTS